MSFQMIHMEIAYRLLNKLPQINNPAEFILGSVAPDSVHMSPSYDVSKKVVSHMFEGCGPWSDTQDYKRWKSNIKNVFESVYIKSDIEERRDFVLGLCVHCLTDYWNDVKIWKRLQGEYLPSMEFEVFRNAYYPEAQGIDQWLYQNSKNTNIIREMLMKAKAFDVKELVAKDNIEKQRSHLLNVQYNVEMIDISSYQFLSAEDIYEFIDFVVDDIEKTIKSWLRELEDTWKNPHLN